MTMLYRISGSTEQIAPDFDDVDPGEYYYYPIGWAQDYGIVYGLTETEFGPEVNITREQLITIVYRYIREYEGIYHTKTNLSANSKHYANWADASSLSDYSKDAVDWAANCGILTSKTNFAFQPGAVASRGICAQYLHAFMKLAFGNAKVFSMNVFQANGNPDIICELVNETDRKDYECITWDDPEAQELLFAFYNSELIYFSGHGSPDSISTHEDGQRTNVHKNDIKENYMSHVDLVYISACKAGQVFCATLYEVGNANCVVGFEQEISHSPTDNQSGDYLFNEYFFQYYREGYNPDAAARLALQDLQEETNASWGCDSYVCNPTL